MQGYLFLHEGVHLQPQGNLRVFVAYPKQQVQIESIF